MFFRWQSFWIRSHPAALFGNVRTARPHRLSVAVSRRCASVRQCQLRWRLPNASCWKVWSLGFERLYGNLYGTIQCIFLISHILLCFCFPWAGKYYFTPWYVWDWHAYQEQNGTLLSQELTSRNFVRTSYMLPTISVGHSKKKCA